MQPLCHKQDQHGVLPLQLAVLPNMPKGCSTIHQPLLQTPPTNKPLERAAAYICISWFCSFNEVWKSDELKFSFPVMHEGRYILPLGQAIFSLVTRPFALIWTDPKTYCTVSMLEINFDHFWSWSTIDTCFCAQADDGYFSQWTFAQNSRIITRQSCIFLSNSTALPYHSTRASFYAQLNRQNNWSTTGMANKLKTCLSLRGMQAFCTTTSSRLVWAFLSLAGPSRPSPRRRSLDQW